MATLVASPVPAPEPDYSNYDNEVEARREVNYIANVAALARAHSGTKNRLIGRTIRFSVADGYAQYLVWSVKPLQLVHLGLGDAYSVSAANIRGLKVKDVEALVAWEDQWIGVMDDHEKFYAELPVGSIVHYDNGFAQFIRCERIEGEKRKRLLPLALVGNWHVSDLPRRQPDGSVYLGHNAQSIVDREPFEPNYSNIWEAKDAEGKAYSMRGLTDTSYLNETGLARFREKRYQAPFDPATEPAIDLSVPEPSAEEQELAGLVRRLDAIVEAARDVPTTIEAARKQLDVVIGLADDAWTDKQERASSNRA